MELDENQEVKHNPFPEYSGKSSIELAREQYRLQSEKEHLEAMLKKVNARYDWVRKAALPTRMEDEGLGNSFTVEGVGRIALSADMHVSVAAALRGEFFAWLRETSRSDLITESVNPSTLKAMAKGVLKAGQVLPACIKATPFTYATITKVK